MASLLALGAGLALPASASATTFCVPGFHAACPDNGTNVAQANLETAMSTNGTDGTADTVIIQAGHTYTDGNSLQAGGTDALTVIGGGPTTVLTSSSSGNVFVVDLNTGNSRTIKLQDLSIVIPASLPDGLGAGVQVAGDTLQDVDVISENPLTDAFPSWVGGGTFDGGTIRGQGAGSVGTAFRLDANTTAPVTIRDATIEDSTTGVSASASQPVVDVTRTRISLRPSGGQVAVTASGGVINVNNSVIETPSGIPTYAFVAGAGAATINVDGTTMVNTGPANKAAINAQVTGGTANATVDVQSSIATGFDFGASSQSNAAGQANIGIDYSNVPLATVDTGAGTVARTNSIAADPLFAGASDYHLQAGSPSIDAGDPGSVLTVDFASSLRPRDGDGDGTPIVDQGAYERAAAAPVDTTPPKTTIDGGPGKRAAKGKPRFRFSANEAATFECRLGKSAWVACDSPQKYKLKRKRKAKAYRFQVRATDLAANTDLSPASKRFKVKKRPKSRHG